MTLNVRIVRDVAAEELSRLVEDSVHSIAGSDFELWETLPRLGDRSLIVQDGDDELSIITFDVSDGNRALLAGLECMEKLNHELAGTFLVDYMKPSRLIVLAPTMPPGAKVLEGCGVDARSFKVVEANGERGLLFEEDGADAGRSARATPIDLDSKRGDDADALSSEEDRFFQQLQ